MKMPTYAYEAPVPCPICFAEPFNPCVYTNSKDNQAKQRVGSTLWYPDGYRHHYQRLYLAQNIAYDYLRGMENQQKLKEWLETHWEALFTTTPQFTTTKPQKGQDQHA